MDRLLPTEEEYYAFLQASEKKQQRFELDGGTWRHHHEDILVIGHFCDGDWNKLVVLIKKNAKEFHKVAAQLAIALGHDAKICVRFTSTGHSLTVSIAQRNLIFDEVNNPKPIWERRVVRTFEDLGLIGTNSSMEDHYGRLLYTLRAVRAAYP